MALKSTVFNVHLTIADIGRGYYHDHKLTLARHPSETDTRLMTRIVVFALNAHERLQFTKGLADVDEPDLWQLDLTGRVEHWIDIGQPAEKRLRQSAGKADRVSVFTYQRHAAATWIEGVRDVASRFAHLEITLLTFDDEAALGRMVDRTMTLNCVIEDEQIVLSSATESASAQRARLA
jgi:uncharacterized protein YaeQ